MNEKLNKLGKIGVFIICVIIVILVIKVYFIGPSVREHQDLYTVAIHNFLGAYGYGTNGEIPMSPAIGVVETDSYGRVLFYYSEGLGPHGCGYGILQKSDGEYAYYYEDDCVFPAKDDWNGNGEITHEEWLNETQLAQLKARNDWDLPLNDNKCSKALIVSQKPEGMLKRKDADFLNAVSLYFAAQGRAAPKSCSSEVFQTADLFGREMYVFYTEDAWYVVIFGPDGSCSGSQAVMEITDNWNYREALKSFKQVNGWNLPLT